MPKLSKNATSTKFFEEVFNFLSSICFKTLLYLWHWYSFENLQIIHSFQLQKSEVKSCYYLFFS